MVFKSFFRVLLLKRFQHRIRIGYVQKQALTGTTCLILKGAPFLIFFFHNMPAPGHVYMG